MKKKEIQEMKNKPLGELERIGVDSGEKLRALRFDLAAGKVKNVNELHQMRKHDRAGKDIHQTTMANEK